MGKGTGNVHYGVCSGWYGYWCSINGMIGLIGGNSDVCVWVVRGECVHGWCVRIVDEIGIDRQSGGFRRGVSEV